jgi:pimeloyl-ACP methyl ester carboxylesterase/predicted glycosyltransferase
MRARQPDIEGVVERDGLRIGYEVFGAGATTVLLMASWPIVNARIWKAQVPYLARHFRVITIDPRGNGRSDRPPDPAAYADAEFVADTLAVMDATATDAAVLVGLCSGARWAYEVADRAPGRVLGIVALAPSVPWVSEPLPWRKQAMTTFDEIVPESAGWAARENRHYWRSHYRDWVEYHSGPDFMTPEPHSTKIREDLVEWGLATTAETQLAAHDAPFIPPFPVNAAATEALIRSVRCPILTIVGTEDRCQPRPRAERLAELSGGRLEVLEGAGHALFARYPVRVNLLIREFVESIARPASEASAPASAPGSSVPAGRPPARARRRPRVLYLSSAIGLGHALRDAAIARELRVLREDVQVDWLTQHPVTAVLDARGERVHPASAWLANESRHVEEEATGHELDVFEAVRRMDEILVANFMVFDEVVRDERYDLVIADEAWEVDHFLFENPRLKRAPLAWMTDFVGWLPMPEGGEREAALTADYNAEMLEHVARHPGIRDRAVFVGDPDDIVDKGFGPGLPRIRPWVEAQFEFAGYVSGFDPAALGPRDELRASLGYRADEPVCVVTVGGSAVGRTLIERVIAAYPVARRRVPGLRMVVVTGPRIDPATFPAADGLEIHGYVDELYRHLVACDLAVVQGGLTTTMELTAAKVPFIYVPIGRHFEQNLHVRHRLERYGAGRRMDFADTTPEALGEAIAAEIGRPVAYRDVATDGAARAAARIAELI